MPKKPDKDKEAARAALEKQHAGQPLSKAEKSALARFRKALDKELRWKHYRTVPKRDYLEMAGRQAKTVNEQGKRWGLPLQGRTVDLAEIVRAFHDFLGEHGQRLATTSKTDEIEDQIQQANLRIKLARVQKDELAIQRELGMWVAREEVHEGYNLVASILRRFGERLQKRFGDDAHRMLDEAIEDCERAVSRQFE